MEENPKVTGLGGVFITCENPESQRQWYSEMLHMKSHEYGVSFAARKEDNPMHRTFSLLSFFQKNSPYLLPGKSTYMINFRVQQLEKLLEELNAKGVEVCGEMEVFEYGKFAHIIDPEGNKIELWEANDEVMGEMNKDLWQY